MPNIYREATIPHNPLTEFTARKNGEHITPEEDEQLKPYEYKLINGVYFMRYMIGEGDSTLYAGKEETFDSNSYAMSICDERGFVYVAVVQDDDIRQNIGRILRRKGYTGFKDLDKGEDFGPQGHDISSHCVPLSSEMGGLDRLIDATGRAHVFHTQFSVKDKARKLIESKKGNKF